MTNNYRLKLEEAFRPQENSELAREKLARDIENFLLRYSVKEVDMGITITPKL